MMKNLLFRSRIPMLIFVALLVPSAAAWAATYYVSGSSGNDANPGTLSQPWKTIGKANAALRAGDTVFVRQGTYRETIRPAVSGTATARITYARHNNEEATITGVADGVDLRNRSYITIDGLRIIDVSHFWVNMQAGSTSRNIIKNCYMEKAGGWGGIYIGDTSAGADYNQILNNVMKAKCTGTDPATAAGGPDDTVRLRGPSRYNLIDGNDIQYGAHAAINFDGADVEQFTIIRNNKVRNPWHSGIIIFSAANRILLENNLVVDSGEEYQTNYCGSDRDRSMARNEHAGLQVGSENNIVRNNAFINNGRQIVVSRNTFLGLNNRLYNNTFYANYKGIDSNTTDPVYGNVFHNNIFYKNRQYEIQLYLTNASRVNHFERNSILGASLYNYPDGSITLSSLESKYPAQWHNNMAKDPLFIDELNRDLHLSAHSPMIDAGSFLTQTTTAGTGTKIPVKDAMYFMDGWGIISGDIIQLQGQQQTASIVDVDYAANTITVSTSLTWHAGQGVALAYQGSAPDMGAYEFSSGKSGKTPNAPSNLVIGAAP